MRRTFLWLLLPAVLGTAGWFLAHRALGSAWGRDVAERRLGRLLDMEITVRSMALEWPFRVVVEGVEGRFPGGGPGSADLNIVEVRLTPCLRRKAEIRRPTLRLVQGPAGDWQPEILRGLAPRPGIEEGLEDILDRVARPLASHWSFEITNATVVGRPHAGEDAPLFGGLTWSVHPLFLEGRGPVRHHRATVQMRAGGSPPSGEPLHFEWLSAPGLPVRRLWSGQDMEMAAGTVSIPDPAPPPTLAPERETEPQEELKNLEPSAEESTTPEVSRCSGTADSREPT